MWTAERADPASHPTWGAVATNNYQRDQICINGVGLNQHFVPNMVMVRAVLPSLFLTQDENKLTLTSKTQHIPYALHIGFMN
jgi:hypothetical protein